MSGQKRPILEIVTSATRQVVKKFKTVTGNLSAPPLGLKEVARQWVATNYKVHAYHNGDAEAMYGRFKEALADAIGDGLNITEYQGFANAEQFQRAHWSVLASANKVQARAATMQRICGRETVAMGLG